MRWAALVALVVLAGCEPAPDAPPADGSAVSTSALPGPIQPSTLAAVATSSSRTMTREETLEGEIAARVASVPDMAGLFPDERSPPRYTLKLLGPDDLGELRGYLDRELLPSDVAGSPDCVLPARKQDRGTRCCVEGPVPIAARTMALVEVGPRKVQVPVYLVRTNPAVPRNERRRFCGVVARLANDATPSARVPALFGYFQAPR